MSLTLTPADVQALTYLGLHEVVRRCFRLAAHDGITHAEKQALGMGLHARAERVYLAR